MEKKMYDLTIDPELRDFIPSPTEKELEKLTSELLEDGCIDPLIVWDGVIVDGHNRYSICHKYDIPFGIKEMQFANKEKAKVWMARHQLARRSLQPFQRCELIYPLAKAIREEANEKRKAAISNAMRGDKMAPCVAETKDSRDVLADMAEVSHGIWDMAVAIIEEGDDAIKIKLRAADMSISAAYKQVRPKKPKKAKDVLNAKPQEKGAGNEPIPKTVEPLMSQSESAPVTKPVSATMPEPLVHMDGPIEVPSMRDKPERKPQPFPYVQDQVRFSIENMIRNLEIAMNWLRDEDQDKVDTLVDMLDKGFDRAEALLRGQEV